MIQYLKDLFEKLDLGGLLIFDGSHKRDEESGRGYQSPLEIIYTPKGLSADLYILEILECQNNKRAVTLVTNDEGLKRQARALGVNVKSCEDFIHFLERKKPKQKSFEVIKESKHNFERLLKIFEDNLKKPLDDDF